MKEMLALLKERGYERASLAVQKANYAVRMYEKVGFRTVDENDEEYIMVCELKGNHRMRIELKPIVRRRGWRQRTILTM